MHLVLLDGYARTIRVNGLTHLETRQRGTPVMSYSRDSEGSQVNRARLTWLPGRTFELGIAEPNGCGAATGETGTVDALLATLMERFNFILADWL